ncbi:MAG: hypothetical protein H6Q90_5429 [Deltaproteobacteria bacterium]|nr:hypothetical protein [Deltaproteobacteria bacterium]
MRAMLAAHDIESVVGGELHANLLGGLGGGLIALDITVAEDDADQAVALLREYREGTAGAPDDAADEPEPGDDPEDAAGDSGPDLRFERRKRVGAALLLAVCISFGTAHMYARAWAWGVALAAVEVFAFAWMARSPTYGALLLFTCVLTDAIGAVQRINRTIARQTRANLPVARVR